MIINATYYVSVLSSLSNIIGEDGIAFGDSKNRSLLKRLAKSYSQKCDDLVIFGRVDDMPETAYFHGSTLSVTYDDELNASFFFVDGDTVLLLKESDSGGFALEKQHILGN